MTLLIAVLLLAQMGAPWWAYPAALTVWIGHLAWVRP